MKKIYAPIDKESWWANGTTEMFAFIADDGNEVWI